MSLFPNKNLEQYVDSFANYLPGGRMFANKNVQSSGLRFFLEGLSQEAIRANDLINTYHDQFFPNTTVDFISEWERVLNIPDDCFDVEGVSLATRQAQVLIKLAQENVQTAADFEELALTLGLIVQVLAGNDPAVFPVITPIKTARFTIVIQYQTVENFPYTFPFFFGTDAASLLRCVFEKIRPANCQVVFRVTL